MTFTVRLTTLACALAVALPLAAAAQDKSKGTSRSAKGQAYDVEFVFDGTSYTGTMTLQIGKKGAVAGKMSIDRPTSVLGDVTGTITGQDLALDYPFTMVEENCTGRVVVEATMTKKRDAAEGKATATGCGDAPSEGTFTMKKTAPGATQ